MNPIELPLYNSYHNITTALTTFSVAYILVSAIKGIPIFNFLNLVNALQIMVF